MADEQEESPMADGQGAHSSSPFNMWTALKVLCGLCILGCACWKIRKVQSLGDKYAETRRPSKQAQHSCWCPLDAQEPWNCSKEEHSSLGRTCDFFAKLQAVQGAAEDCLNKSAVARSAYKEVLTQRLNEVIRAVFDNSSALRPGIDQSQLPLLSKPIGLAIKAGEAQVVLSVPAVTLYYSYASLLRFWLRAVHRRTRDVPAAQAKEAAEARSEAIAAVGQARQGAKDLAAIDAELKSALAEAGKVGRETEEASPLDQLMSARKAVGDAYADATQKMEVQQP